MKPLSSKAIATLKISEAIAKEADSRRNLVPDEIDWNQIRDNSRSIEQWLRKLLQNGFHPSGQQIITVRKLQGTRPVPIWGVAERIIYRALTQAALGKAYNFDRSSKAYLEFVTAPVRYSRELQAANDPADKLRIFYFLRSDIRYVVKADITAFYQYVDHAILARELLIHGADLEITDALLELLAEVQGRAFGIPQLLDASDMLSEIYIDCLERDVLRQGLAVWRYNDDFRIACKSYEDALIAIELLDVAARKIGLVISESKTLIYKFFTYMTESLNLELTPGQDTLSLDDVEATIGDYTDDFSDDPDAAVLLIKKAVAGAPEDEGAINIRSLTASDLRLLRRAFGSLTQAVDPRVVDQVHPLVIYIPALFPSIIRYLRAIYDVDSASVAQEIDTVVANASMNEWQHQWAIQAIHQMNLLDSSSHGSVERRVEWIQNLRTNSPSSITAAYATRTLGTSGNMSIDDLMRAHETSPSALSAIYTDALAQLARASGDKATKKRVESVRKTSPIHSAIIGDLDANSTPSGN